MGGSCLGASFLSSGGVAEQKSVLGSFSPSDVLRDWILEEGESWSE